jgi:hypothetical protein
MWNIYLSQACMISLHNFGANKAILFWKAMNEVSVLYYEGLLLCHLDVMKSILM